MAIRRGVGVVLTILILGILVSLAGIITLFLMVGRQPTVSTNSVLTLRVDGDLEESSTSDAFGGLMSRRRPTVRGLVDNLHKAKVDQRVKSVIIKPGNLTSAYWGKIQEIRDAIIDFRKSGKQAVAYLELGGTREYFVATGCDQIYLTPSSPVDLAGLATYTMFLKGTLDKIGAQADYHKIGEYKTAPNQLTEKTFTPAHREMEEALTEDFFEQLVQAVADGRKKTTEDVRTLIDDGPFLPDAAKRAGLIDDVKYEDQMEEAIAGKGKALTKLDGDEYARVSLESLGLGRGPKIAVIYAVGLINSGKSGYDPLNGAVVGSDTLVDYIRKARKDSSIKAIVLRIDSPGGSAIASDVIWRELSLARTGANPKPVVASMSDLAASGGYYIAMAASDVVAQPGTLTGSIGIYGGKIVTGGTYEKLGISVEAISRGKNAEMDSPVRPFNASESAKIDEQLKEFYDQFVAKVAESRKMSAEMVDGLGRGHVWTGKQAKHVKLVDELGGLDRAIAIAKNRAKIPENQGVELVTYPPKRSLFEVLSDSIGSNSDNRAELAALLGFTDKRAVGIVTAPMRIFRRGEILALMPMGFVQ